VNKYSNILYVNYELPKDTILFSFLQPAFISYVVTIALHYGEKKRELNLFLIVTDL
jgi:hypothetical protein